LVIIPGPVFENHAHQQKNKRKSNNNNNNKQPATQKGNHPPETTSSAADASEGGSMPVALPFRAGPELFSMQTPTPSPRVAEYTTDLTPEKLACPHEPLNIAPCALASKGASEPSASNAY
jgi:hypothetical protein